MPTVFLNFLGETRLSLFTGNNGDKRLCVYISFYVFIYNVILFQCIGKDDTVSYLWEIKNLNLAPQQCDKSLVQDTDKKTPQITSSDSIDKSITAETASEDSGETLQNQDSISYRRRHCLKA